MVALVVPPFNPISAAGEFFATRSMSIPSPGGGTLRILGGCAGDKGARRAAPKGSPLKKELARNVGGSDKAQSFGPSGFRDNGTHNADDLSRHVKHWTAGISLVDRCIGLKKLGQRKATINSVGLPASANVSNGQRVADPVRRSDNEDLIADLNFV